MLELLPMNESEFDVYIKESLNEFKYEQIKTGNWHTEEADARAQKLFGDLLPQGRNTPGHFFYHLVNNRQKVGILWIADHQQYGKRMVFIFDIRVFPEFQRRGFATRAFEHIESIAKEMDIPNLGLFVFEHNLPARALYKKLGFIEEGNILIKQLQF